MSDEQKVKITDAPIIFYCAAASLFWLFFVSLIIAKELGRIASALESLPK